MKVSKCNRINHNELFDTIPLGVVYRSSEGHVLSVNSAAEKILGMSFEQMHEAKSFDPSWKSMKEDGSPFLEEEYPALLALITGIPVCNVIMGVYNQEQNKQFWINLNAIPLFRDGEKRPYQVCTFFSDITEQKLAEEALRVSEERFKGLSEAAFEAIFISERGMCIEQNTAAQKMFGYTSQDAIGRMGTDWIVAEDHKKVMNMMLSGFEEPYEVTAQRKDRSVFPAEIQAKMMHYKGKTVRVTALRDITLRTNIMKDLIFAKDKAEESDRLKSVFLTTMNHELRTPLNHILGFSAILQESIKDNELKEFAKFINQSGYSLLGIIEDIFKLATKEQDENSIIIQSFKCEDLYHDLKKSLQEILNNSGKSQQINLAYSTDEKLLKSWLRSDRSKIIQVMLNLFKNAVKFTDHGSIEFGLQRTNESEITFFVKDTGIGISDDKQEFIFELFRQVDDSFTRVYNGIGVGLAISNKVAVAMNGRITVESSLGKGSAFYFTIPTDFSQSGKTD